MTLLIVPGPLNVDYIRASYANLVTVFGTPNDLDQMDDYKSRAQWRVHLGRWLVMIYDWKTGPDWMDNPLPVERLTIWHMQAVRPAADWDLRPWAGQS